MRSISALIRALFFSFIALAPGLLRAEPLEFNLPAQPVGAALLALSQQAKIEILFSSDDLRKVQSTELVGLYEPEIALNLLLKNSGYLARKNWRGKFVVTAAPPPTGTIKGRLITSDGVGARGLRVGLVDTRQVVATDADGEFSFPAVPVGTYRLVATGRGFQPLQITGAQVAPGHTLTLEPHVLRMTSDLTQLDAVVVEGQSARLRPFDRSQSSSAPRIAAGNLDLPRTQDDVLPYNIYDREQIARSGAVNLNDFIQREIVDSDAGTRPPEQTPGLPNEQITGSQNQRLRGYSDEETVLLVNGRRLPEIVVTSSIGGNKTQQPDVNFIPLSLVQRVEVLPVSASALYSGNPVGGVINIVLRPNADATEVTTTYTNTLDRYDAPQSTVTLQHGRSLLGGKLQVRFSATFTRVEPATEAELGHIRAHLQSPATPSVYRATPNVRSADDSPLFGPGSSNVTSVAPGADGTGGLVAFSGRQGVRNFALFDSVGGLANSSNSVDFPYGRRQQGSSYFGSVTYDLFPWLQLGADGIYTHTVFNRGYNVFPGDLSLAASSPFNPFGKDVNVSLLEIAPGLGEAYSEARLDFSSIVLGALVKLPAAWRVSLDGQYGRNLTRYRGLAGVSSDNWQQLVDQQLYNPLRDTQRYGPPDAFYDRVLKYYGSRGHFVTLGDYATFDAAARVTNQSLQLPTGSSSISFGTDYRFNHLTGYPGVRRFGDGSLADTPTPTAARTVERISVFGEIQTPLVPARWLPGWIREIKTEIAARYVAAATAQESNLAPTGGLKVDFAGGFSVRGTLATSNRLPTPVLSRAVAAPVTPGSGSGDVSYVSIKQDPLRGNEPNDKVVASELTNPNLLPEAAVTRTFGIIYQHGQVHRFRAAFDIADTNKSRELTFLDAQNIVDLESLFPGRVSRAPSDGKYPVGPVTSVLTGTFNLAFRHSQNWNTSFDYAWTECFGGRFDLYAHWLYFQRYDVQLVPGSATVDELQHPDGVVPNLLQHRINLGAGWSNHQYGFGLDGHYFSSRKLKPQDQTAQGSDHIDSQWQFDAYVQSDLARWLPWKSNRFGLRGQLRVNNLFDARPPKFANEPSGTGVQSYGDWRGQVYSASVTATF